LIFYFMLLEPNIIHIAISIQRRAKIIRSL
jgi:hypothetical protein